MLRSKLLVSLLIVFIVLIALPGLSIFANPVTQNIEKNDYVKLYEAHIDINNKSYYTNINKEDRLVIDTLNQYFEEDLRTAEILSKHSNISPKLATSSDKNDKITVINELQKVFYILTTDEDIKNVLSFFDKYAVNSGDISSIDFLKQNKMYNNKVFVTNSEKFIEQENKIKNNKMTYEESTNNFSPYAVDGYMAGIAANWEYDNYDKYSTDFPKLTEGPFSDCINFVSQALYKGYMAMEDNWYCYKKNNTYPIPKTTEELNYSWNLSDPSAWISVREFCKTWSRYSNVGNKYYSKSDYVENHDTIYHMDYYRGDVVILHKGVGILTVPTHAMIISMYDIENKDFRLAGHSQERQELPPLDAIESYAGFEFFYFQ